MCSNLVGISSRETHNKKKEREIKRKIQFIKKNTAKRQHIFCMCFLVRGLVIQNVKLHVANSYILFMRRKLSLLMRTIGNVLRLIAAHYNSKKIKTHLHRGMQNGKQHSPHFKSDINEMIKKTITCKITPI